MNVQFILGGAGTGKTTLIFEEIVNAQAEDGEEALILVVPEQASFQSEKALLSAMPDGALSRARVLSFNRLCYYVLSKTGGMGQNVLEKNGKHMVLRKIVSQLDKKLTYFRTAKETKGFLDTLATQVSEFFHYDIDPKKLEAQRDAATETSLKHKLSDLYLIYSEYKNFLENNFISSDEMLDVLALKIPQADFLRGAKIWIDGFKSFTPQEKKALEALIKTADQVKIALPSPKKLNEFNLLSRLDIYGEVVQTMQGLAELTVKAGAKLEEPEILREPFRHKNADDIAFLCEHYLSFGKVKPYTDAPKNLRVYAATSIFDEINHAALTVTHLTRDRGYKYGEIGIIAANLAAYDKYAQAIFTRHGIPIFVDARRSIMGHPVVEFILRGCKVISSNWNYEAVFSFLRLPIFENQEEFDALENYVLAHNIRGKMWQADFAFGEDTGLDELNQARTKLVEVMAVLHNAFTPRKKHTLKDFAHKVYEFLIANNIPDVLEKWADDAARKGENERLREHEQIWGIIMQALDKMVEILPDQTEPINGFAKIFEAGMADLGLSPPSLDQLVMGDMRRTRFGDIKALIMLGCRDGAMPSRPADDGLLSDDDRFALENAGTKLAANSEAKIYEEEFLIYANIAKPTEFLALSYPAGDLDGKSTNPARIISRVHELFPKINEHDKALLEFSNPEYVLAELTTSLANHAIKNEPITPNMLSAYAFFKQNESYAAKIKKMQMGLHFSQNDSKAKLSQKAVQNIYKPDVRTSVSKLSKYIGCPFSYFVEYNLKAKPRKIHEVAAADMGNVYHDILSKFGEELRSMDKSTMQDESKMTDLVTKIIDDVFADPQNKALQSSGRYMHFADKMRSISSASAQALVNHLSNGNFALKYNEVAFGDNTANADYSLPPIGFELTKGAKMLLEGRIDRVDADEIDGTEYVKIIDYKSGRTSFSLSEVYHGLDMQLLVYLGAFVSQVAKIHGEATAKKIMPAAAFYFNLQNPFLDYDKKLDDPDSYKKKIMDQFKMSGVLLEAPDVLQSIGNGTDSYKKTSEQIPAQAFAALIDHTMYLAKKTGEAILKGEIAIFPAKHKDKSPCTFCNYHAICKFDQNDQNAHRNLPKLSNADVVDSF